MKAVYIEEHGGLEVLTHGDLPEPEIGPNDIKVRVRACALNRLDVFTRMGVRGTRIEFSGPHVLGGDIAGDVVDTGSEVTRVQNGDRILLSPKAVCRQCDYCLAGDDELCVGPVTMTSTRPGGYAEFVAAPGTSAVLLPSGLGYEEAASIPTVFLPSWTILVRRAKLQPWETVLIVSASSGVGTAAIQLAKHVIGARVIATTSSEEKAKLARDLGADEVIDYTREDVAARIKELTGGRGVDVVVDHVGTDAWAYAMRSLAQGGRYGICGVTSGYKAELQMGLLFLKNQTVFGAFMGRMGDLPHIVELAGKGVIRGVVHETFPLAEAARAHEAMEARGFFGKLVLTVP